MINSQSPSFLHVLRIWTDFFHTLYEETTNQNIEADLEEARSSN